MPRQITKGAVATALDALPTTAKDRANARAHAFGQLKLNLPFSFNTLFTSKEGQQSQLRITITRLAIRDVRGTLVFEVDLEASTRQGAGGFEPLQVSNPFEFVNPPVLVPDGTFSLDVVRGREVQIPNLREDLLEAARTMIAQTVVAATRIGTL
jgi:hypothetical protein